ncbi:MAG: hypothetical protein ACT4OF_15275 [Caulobacteraceae bacterium]
MLRHAVSVVAYIVATVATQAVSHFWINAAHYAAVPYIKPEPIFALGIASMVIQGAVLSYVYANSRFGENGLKGALLLAWLLGDFLVSYIGLAEAAKYAVPSVASWIAVEVLTGAAQFTLAGLLLWLAHNRLPAAAVHGPA